MKGMAAIYGHVQEDVELRQRIVREVGIGFTLPRPVQRKPEALEPELAEAIA